MPTKKKQKKKAPAKKRPSSPRKPKRAPSKRATATRVTATPAMFQKVAFTMFAVDDPTRARSFYEDVLGFTRGLASNDGTWTEYDLPGGGCLALFRHPDPQFQRRAGGASIAFEVSDLDALNARLQAAGVTYEGGVVHGPHCRMSNIVDSEGNGIILHELAKRR